MIIFLDCETTGLPDWRAPSTAKQQPHIVQLAALLTDNEGHGKKAMNVVIKPDGWVIPQEMSDIHGITQQHALEEGISIKLALERFTDLLREASLAIAFNMGFDARMIRIQMLRNRGKFGEWAKAWKKWPKHDAAIKAKPLCKLPPTDKMLAAGIKSFKPPKLTEALRILCNMEMGEDAHDASHDVKALRQVFFAIQRLDPIVIPSALPDAPDAPTTDPVGDDGPDDGIPSFDTDAVNKRTAGEAPTEA